MALSELTTRSSPAKIGFLGATSPTIWSRFVLTFEKELRTLGWTIGDDLLIDYQWAYGLQKNFKSIAEGFVSNEVDIIVTSSTGAAIEAQIAINSAENPEDFHVYYAAAGDPNNTSLTPSGNIDGDSNGQTVLASDRVKFLREVLPRLKKLAIIGNLASPNVPCEKAAVEKAAATHGIKTRFFDIRQPWEIANIITDIGGKAHALFVCTDALLTTYQVAVNTAAVSAGLPTMHAFREYVMAGGLMSYGPDFCGFFKDAAVFVDSYLNGGVVKIPVKPIKPNEIFINLSTAYELGVTIPDSVLNRVPADNQLW